MFALADATRVGYQHLLTRLGRLCRLYSEGLTSWSGSSSVAHSQGKAYASPHLYCPVTFATLCNPQTNKHAKACGHLVMGTGLVCHNAWDPRWSFCMPDKGKEYVRCASITIVKVQIISYSIHCKTVNTSFIKL